MDEVKRTTPLERRCLKLEASYCLWQLTAFTAVDIVCGALNDTANTGRTRVMPRLGCVSARPVWRIVVQLIQRSQNTSVSCRMQRQCTSFKFTGTESWASPLATAIVPYRHCRLLR